LAEPITAIVYDLDGTLFDTGPNIAFAVNAVRAHYGLGPLDAGTIVGFVGDGTGRLMTRSLFGVEHSEKADGVDMLDRRSGPDMAEVHRVFMTIYSDHPARDVVPYPGVPEALEYWHQKGVKQAVLTNKPHALAVRCVADLGYGDILPLVIGRGAPVDGQYIPTKPDPTGLAHILDELDTGKEGAWMVGDGQADLLVARAYGISSVIIYSGFCDRARFDAMDEPPTLAFETFAESFNYLRELGQTD
jgi:phosphoglycolate phosphatase